MGVLEFFLHPVDRRLQAAYQVPRYEILATSPYPDRFVVEREQARVERVLEALATDDALTIDADHTDGPRAVVVPTVLMEAHKAAKFVGERFKRILINEVWRLYVASREGGG